MADFVDLDGHVVAHELEARLSMKMLDIALGAREEVVDTQHLVSLRQQAINQVRT
jgi:hypothetical protein